MTRDEQEIDVTELQDAGLALEAKGVCHNFGSNQVLVDLDIVLPLAKISGLIGPSGSGKSVLMKALAGVFSPSSGEIRSIYHTGVAESSHGLSTESSSPQGGEVSLMFQEGALFDSISVFDNVAFPLVSGRVPTGSLSLELRKRVRDQVEAILTEVGLETHAYKMPAQLSGGMRRRVSLARALVSRPKLVFLDDPTCGLDPVASSVIMELIVKLHKEYEPTMLIVSHDLRRLLPVVERVFCLFDGRIVFGEAVQGLTGAPEQVQQFVSCRYDIDRLGAENVR